MSYWTEARDTALLGLGLASPEQAVKTIASAAKDVTENGTDTKVPSPVLDQSPFVEQFRAQSGEFQIAGFSGAALIVAGAILYFVLKGRK